MVIFLSWNSSAFHKFCFLWCRGTSRRLDLVNANATAHQPPNNWIQFISKASRADKFAWLYFISSFRCLIPFADLTILWSRLRLLCLETSWKHCQIRKIRKVIWWRGRTSLHAEHTDPNIFQCYSVLNLLTDLGMFFYSNYQAVGKNIAKVYLLWRKMRVWVLRTIGGVVNWENMRLVEYLQSGKWDYTQLNNQCCDAWIHLIFSI